MAKTLGKGLEALIQSYGGEKKEKYLHGNLPIKNIIPNKNQPRQYFNTKEMELLADSIKKHGIEEKDLKPFQAPSLKEIKSNETEIHYFSYYKYWDPQENFYYASKFSGFERAPALDFHDLGLWTCAAAQFQMGSHETEEVQAVS